METTLTSSRDTYCIMLKGESGISYPFRGGLTWEEARIVYRGFGGKAKWNGVTVPLSIHREICEDIIEEMDKEAEGNG